MTKDDVIEFLYREARMLDEKRFDEWYELFTEDAYYWVPATPKQPDGANWVSLAYEDKLLLKLRIERLKNPKSYSQHPESRPHHVLQRPEIESQDGAAWKTRTSFMYVETRADEQQVYGAVAWHTLVETNGGLRIRLKRVDIVNCDAALPSIQMFL